MKSARPKGQASFADHSGRNGSVQICLGSAEQLPDKRRGIVRDGVAAPSGVLIGARQNELWSLGRSRFENIDCFERDAVAAHRISQWRNRNIGIVAHQRVTRPKRVIDRPALPGAVRGR